jgi:hypothetical protein
MKKSTYIILGLLSLIFVAYGSVTYQGSGLAFFIGEVAGTFTVLYLLCMGVFGVTKIGSFIVSKLKKTE